MSISVNELSKFYGNQQALKQISFEVRRGEVLGFLGPNGAGKSTTMKIMTGFIAPDAGSVEICGLSVPDYPLDVRRKIGYLPEHNPLYTDMDIPGFLRYSGRLHHMTRKTLSASINRVIETCGLAPEAHKMIHELSKGYRQRVGIAHALLHDPDVLILDEPTSGLDPNQIVDIRDLIREIGKEKTVILSSHILKEVEATCGRVVIINDGSIVADEATETLIQKATGTRQFYVVLGGVDDRHKTEEILSAQFTSVARSNADYSWVIETGEGKAFQQKLSALCHEYGWHIEELRPVENSLEDIFRKLTSSTQAA